jgi:putative component of toxin-antitoxin plasmid stabilization module
MGRSGAEFTPDRGRYYGKICHLIRRPVLVVLLYGGDKKSQRLDIEKAKAMAKDVEI